MKNLKGEELYLVEKIRKGDKRAYELIFNRYLEDLTLLSFRIVKDRFVAEEIVQNFFVQLWFRREEIRISTSFRAYIFRSIYNASISVLRVKNKFIPVDEFVNSIAEEDILSENLIDSNSLNTAVDSLPQQCRKVFMLVCIDGLSYAEVAEEMGLSVNTVKVQMSKAYRQLRQHLSRELLISIIVMAIV